MKYLLTTVFFSLSVLAASGSRASTIDTMYVDSSYSGTSIGIESLSNAFGKPDKQYATLSTATGGIVLQLIFYRHNGAVVTKEVLPIKRKSTLIIWGRKNLDVDSSAGSLSLAKEDDINGFFQTAPVYLGDGKNVIQVPDTDFTFLEFSLPGIGTSTFAKSYSIDAVAVIEDTSTAPDAVRPADLQRPGGLIANYPNPFANATNVQFALPVAGNASLVAVDMQGNEHGRAELGYLNEGEHRVPFDLRDHGMYFLRLFVNGMPVGNPIKVISQ